MGAFVFPYMDSHDLSVEGRLARIETKIDQLVKHESRISALERWRSWSTGAVLGIGVLWKFLHG